MLRILLVHILFVFTLGIPAQKADNIVLSLQTGNAKELSKHFNDMVSVVLVEEESIYSKDQAQVIFKDFFSTHPVKEYKVMHSGVSENSGSKYQIGELTTTSGVIYRTYLYFKEVDNTFFIQEIRIEEN